MQRGVFISILLHGAAIFFIIFGLPRNWQAIIEELPPIVVDVPTAQVMQVPAPSGDPAKDPGEAKQADVKPAPAPPPPPEPTPLKKIGDDQKPDDAAAEPQQSADAKPATANEVRIKEEPNVPAANIPADANADPKAEPLYVPSDAQIAKPADDKHDAVRPPDPPKPLEIKKDDAPRPAAPRKLDAQKPDAQAVAPAARGPAGDYAAPSDKSLSEQKWRDKDLSVLEGCWVLGHTTEATMAEGDKVIRGITRAGRLCFDRSGNGTRQLVQEFPGETNLTCQAPIKAVFTADGRLATSQPPVGCEPRSSKVTWNGPPNALSCVRESDRLAICVDGQGTKHEFRRSGG